MGRSRHKDPQYHAKYYLRNRAKALMKAKGRRRDPQVVARERAAWWRKKYGITPAQYAVMLAAQAGVCAICRGQQTQRNATGDLRPLAVDHDHETGSLRGLLCGACNGALGLFKDNRANLAAAIEYLNRYGGTK